MNLSKFSDLSYEEATLLKNENYVYIVNKPEKDIVYYMPDFLATKLAVADFFKHMPAFDHNDPERELKIFTYIYTKLSSLIQYDHFAQETCSLTGYYRDQMADDLNRAANAYGGLLLNKSLCSGYSTTLKTLLEEQGIAVKSISGGARTIADTSLGSHMWTQVCLDGRWYNCDLTNDCDFIKEGLTAPYFLKSNSDFSRFEKYPPHNPEYVEDCQTSISPETQELLINEANEYLTLEASFRDKDATQETEHTEETPRFIQKLLQVIKSNRQERGRNQ